MSEQRHIDMDQEIEVICKKHGSFFITPRNHLGENEERVVYGCPKCGDHKLSGQGSTPVLN